MVISERQFQVLFTMLYESLRITGLFGGLTSEAQLALYNEILNQQSAELVKIGKERKATE